MAYTGHVVVNSIWWTRALDCGGSVYDDPQDVNRFESTNDHLNHDESYTNKSLNLSWCGITTSTEPPTRRH